MNRMADFLKKWMIIRFTPYQMNVLQKPFVQIILAAKWFVRHSRTGTSDQQRQPLLSVLSLSFF